MKNECHEYENLSSQVNLNRCFRFVLANLDDHDIDGVSSSFPVGQVHKEIEYSRIITENKSLILLFNSGTMDLVVFLYVFVSAQIAHVVLETPNLCPFYV